MSDLLEVSETAVDDTTLSEGIGVHESMLIAIWKRFRKHPGAVAGAIVFTILLVSITLVSFSPYDPEASDMINRYQPPSAAHPFGTDALGRDLLTRVLYGGRISIAVGLLAVTITLIIGLPVGAISGFFGGWIDNILMRITDAALAFPPLLILIMMSAFVRELNIPFIEQNNVLVMAFVIGILGWMTVARLVRATFLAIREMDFVTAARSMGASTPRIMLVEILPNSIGPVIVESTLEVAWAIMTESGLSFLGFGIRPPTPSWGNLLSAAQEHMTQYPWLALFPGIMIFFTIISINYIGDGLRDAFDPHKVIGKIE